MITKKENTVDRLKINIGILFKSPTEILSVGKMMITYSGGLSMILFLSRQLTGLLSQLLIFSMLIFSSVVVNSAVLPKMIEPQVGQSYYTRYNFKYEKGKHLATNYWRGEFVPFNTKVTLESMDKKKLVLDMDGVKINIVNVKKFTQRDIKEIASELLSPKKISLKGTSSDLAGDMQSGVMRLGMTKDQVLITRGYPPRHKTPSTKANTWVYWSSRFVQRSVVFEKGKLARGRGLY